MAISSKFFCISGTGSGQNKLEVAKFNSAHQDLSIEGCNITVSQPNPEIAVQNRPFLAIFHSAQYRQSAWIPKFLRLAHAPKCLGPRNMLF